VKTIALQDGKTSLLSTEMSSEWAINPVSREIAFRSEALSIQDGDPTWRVTRSSIKLANFGHSGLNVSLTASAGKNLAWSQDGKTLAYFKDIQQTLSIVFINESRQPYEYSIIGTSKLFLVGWLNVPANTPTGTPSSGS